MARIPAKSDMTLCDTTPRDAALPFDGDDPSFNRSNALYLAHASDVAYYPAPAKAARERLGLKTIAFRHKVTRTRGFVGVCDTHAVLAFRGTDPVTLPSWLTDVVVKLVESADYEGRVHFGFSSVLGRTCAPDRNNSGRSAGQAAVRDWPLDGRRWPCWPPVAWPRWGVRRSRPTRSAPRVGDLTFCSGYALPTYRVVNRLDIVPEMPLTSVERLLPKKVKASNKKALARLKELAEQAPCYGHVNTFVYIDRDGVITADADIEPWHQHAVAGTGYPR